jgi:hypothetical protein
VCDGAWRAGRPWLHGGGGRHRRRLDKTGGPDAFGTRHATEHATRAHCVLTSKNRTVATVHDVGALSAERDSRACSARQEDEGMMPSTRCTPPRESRYLSMLSSTGGTELGERASEEPPGDRSTGGLYLIHLRPGLRSSCASLDPNVWPRFDLMTSSATTAG